jgi:hypothetical protein
MGHWLLGFFDPGKREHEKGVPWAHRSDVFRDTTLCVDVELKIIS